MINIVVRDTTLQEFYDSPEAKKREESPEVAYLESLMRNNPNIPMESMFLDFLRYFNKAALTVRPNRDSGEEGEVLYHQIQSVFQDLLLAKRRLEKEEFDSWMSAPAYEKGDDNATC